MKKPQIALVLASVIILAGLFYYLKTHSRSLSSSTSVGSAVNLKTFNQQNQASSSASIKQIDLVIKNKKIVTGSSEIQLTEGDQVVLTVTCDEPEELHLHGYDLMLTLSANTPASLKFTANMTGRFPFELEHSKTDLGVVDVLPK